MYINVNCQKIIVCNGQFNCHCHDGNSQCKNSTPVGWLHESYWWQHLWFALRNEYEIQWFYTWDRLKSFAFLFKITEKSNTCKRVIDHCYEPLVNLVYRHDHLILEVIIHIHCLVNQVVNTLCKNKNTQIQDVFRNVVKNDWWCLSEKIQTSHTT